MLPVFRRFIDRKREGDLDVSGVISRDCYLAWLAYKHMKESKDSPAQFRRSLINSVSGEVRGLLLMQGLTLSHRRRLNQTRKKPF